MTLTTTVDLRALVGPGLDVGRLRGALAPTASVHSALTDWDGLSRDQALALVVAETTAPQDVSVAEFYSDAGHQVVVLTGTIGGHRSRQLLFATLGADGQIAELRSFYKFMLPFSLVREQVRARLTDLPAEVWRVPALRDDDGAFHETQRTAPYAADLVFNSPVLRQGATPEPLAALVLSHASSVYGIRQWSDFAVVNGDRRVRLFEADMAGQEIEVANVLTFRGEELAEIVAFSRPWVGAIALYTRVQRRIGDVLGPTFFWAEQPDHETYI